MTRDALFRQASVLAVDRLDELSELVATLSWQPLPAGRRTAVISNAGGVGVTRARPTAWPCHRCPTPRSGRYAVCCRAVPPR